jgi:DNA-binding LytR/AlgR family response regulator
MYMKIRCLIIDDEPLAVRLVSTYCSQVPELEVVATCSSAIDAFAVLRQQRIDLLFLDIKMPRLLGTDFLRSLPDPPKVILITAYREYALDGYELDIVDYLLKPVSFMRFMKAVEKAGRLISQEWSSAGRGAVEGESSREPFLYFRINKEMVKVLLSEILFLESRKEYVMLYLEGNKNLLVKQSISSLEKLLSPHRFIRVHRSYMVTKGRISAYNATKLRIGGHDIPVGRFYKHNIEELLKP